MAAPEYNEEEVLAMSSRYANAPHYPINLETQYDDNDLLNPEGQLLRHQSSRWSFSRPPSYVSNPRTSTDKLVGLQDTSYHPSCSKHSEDQPFLPHKTVPSMRRRVLLAVPALISASTWGAMLIYFQAYYLNLDREDDGSFPRIGFTYGGVPFISCIGAVRPTVFQACCIIVACCTWWIFAIDCWIGSKSCRFASMRGWRQNWWYTTTRILKLFAAVCGGAFLIGLSYANVEHGSQRDTHLILTTLQVIGMGGTRFWDFFASREIVSRLESIGRVMPKTMALSKKIKTVEAIVCTGGALVVFPAIWGCSNDYKIISIHPIKIGNSGRCYGLLSYGAVLEWTMSIAWLFYMLSTGWDLVYLWEWIDDLKDVPASWKAQRSPKPDKRQPKRGYLAMVARIRDSMGQTSCQ